MKHLLWVVLLCCGGCTSFPTIQPAEPTPTAVNTTRPVVIVVNGPTTIEPRQSWQRSPDSVLVP
jgi:hypothetical protein